MFGGNEYWWMGALIFLLFFAINLTVFLLRNKPRVSYALAYGIAVFLLIYKVGENIYWQSMGKHMNFPVEFSALSYLLFAVFTVFKIKKADEFAVFAAILAGFIYSGAFAVFPDLFAPGGKISYWIAIALLNHHLLYFGGMLMLANVRKYRIRNCYMQFLGIGALIGYSWAIHLFTDYSAEMGKPIIIQITEGSILYRVFPAESVSDALVVLYYVCAVLMILILLTVFYLINRRCVRRRVAAGLPEDALEQ